MIINKSPNKTRLLLSIGAALILVGISAFTIAYYLNSKNETERDAAGTSLERSNDEKRETQSIQDNPSESKQQTGSDVVPEASVNESTSLRNVNVILTSTGAENGEVDASGFVSNIVEEGGTCVFTFSQKQKVVSKTTTTTVNPTSTTCLSVRFNESELGPGEWKVSLRYKSANAAGTSNEGSLQIK